MAKPKKDPAAVALGLKRWVGVPADEAFEQRSAAGKARTESLSAKRRKEIAMMGVAARLAGSKKRKKS